MKIIIKTINKVPKWFERIFNKIPTKTTRIGPYSLYYSGQRLSALNFKEFDGWYFVYSIDVFIRLNRPWIKISVE